MLLCSRQDRVGLGSDTTTLRCHAGSSKCPLGHASAPLSELDAEQATAADIQRAVSSCTTDEADRGAAQQTGVRMTGAVADLRTPAANCSWWLGAVWAGEGVYQEEGVLVTCGMPMMLSNALHALPPVCMQRTVTSGKGEPHWHNIYGMCCAGLKQTRANLVRRCCSVWS